jgi:hypothetical protein
MSPTIRSVDGKPLMIGGLVAGADECCCGNPPPLCQCPQDWCQYAIEITSPASITLSAGNQCAGDYQQKVVGPPSMSPAVSPYGGLDPCEEPGGEPYCIDSSTVQVYNASPGMWGLTAIAFSRAARFKDGSPPVYPRAGVYAQVSLEARVRCDSADGSGDGFGFFLDIRREIAVENFLFDGSTYCFYFEGKYKTVKLPSSCPAVGERFCGDNPSYASTRVSQISTPVEFTLSLDTTSFGDYESTVTSARNTGDCSDLFDAVIGEGFSATFRITSRPNCNPVGCDCTEDISGLKVFWYRADFILYTPQSWSYSGNDPFIELYEYYGGNGTAGTPYEFRYERYDATINYLYEKQEAYLWCAMDDTVDPPVNRWYVRQQATCYTRDPDTFALLASTLDSWIGHLDCYEAGQCDPINEGDIIPWGTPEMEREPGFPVDTLGVGCEPPTLKQFGNIRTTCVS